MGTGSEPGPFIQACHCHNGTDIINAMLVSLKWIEKFIKTGQSAEETAHSLTMSGLEIEGIETVGDDHVLEVNVTPNRSDALSVLGVARELSAITGKDLTLPPYEVQEHGPSEFKIEILDKELCPRYAGRVIKDVKIEESPDWMKDMLDKCGIRSINNIVDITNYVLFEFGHPLHAFDLAKLEHATIRVGVAGSGVKFRTLDGSERQMPEDALMILDGSGHVAVAGVMGGAETEVSGSTTDVFLESAYFNPASIRKTSKLLGLSTDASYRFERGTDIRMLEHAMDRAARLMAEIAGGTVLGKVDAWPGEVRFPHVLARPGRINKVLGTDIPRDEMTGILTRLGMEVAVDGDSMVVTPPTFRPDITIEADIIEEVARMHGYDNIPTAVPVAGIESTGGQPSDHMAGHLAGLKSILNTKGFHESVNYSFMNIKALDTLGLKDDDKRRKCVKVMNPLRSEDEHMRTSLVPALIENLSYNISHGAVDVRLFEASKVFLDKGEELPYEPMRIAAVLHKGSSQSLYKDSTEAFFSIKGVLEALLGGLLRLSGVEYSKKTVEPFLHPGKGADITVSGKKAGYVGVLSPDVVVRSGIKTKHEVAVFELNLDTIFDSLPESPEYKSVPRFPAVERDMALVLDWGVSSADALQAIRSNASEFMEDASVFDVYEGKGVPEGKKSLAFNIRYRAGDRTMTDEEVDTIHSALVNEVIKKTGGVLRS